MASGITSWKSPTTASTYNSSNSVNWTNPTNVFASDNALATSALAKNGSTWIMRVGGFGFTNADVPSNAVIMGVEVRIERHASGSGAVDNALYLVAAENRLGTNKASAGNWGTAANVYTSYGSSSDSWGADLAASQIYQANFGLDFGARCGTTARTVNVDHIEIRLHWSTDVYGEGSGTLGGLTGEGVGYHEIPPGEYSTDLTAGSGVFIVPPNCTKLDKIECWGMGASDGSGGGGGAYSAIFDLQVENGQELAFSISSYPGSWFGSSNLILAASAGRTVGGQASAGVGTVRYSGGNANGSGGGAASPFGDGEAGQTSMGGSSPGAGLGGQQPGNPTNNGQDHPLGGGGAVYYQGASGNGGFPGGGGSWTGGGGGLVRVTYTISEPPKENSPAAGAGSLNAVSGSGSAKHGVNGSAAATLSKPEGEGYAVVIPAQGAATRTTLDLQSYTAFSKYSQDYMDARAGGAGVVTTEYPWIGQYLNGSTYEVNQSVLTFNTSTLGEGDITATSVTIDVAESYGDNIVELRIVPANQFIPGADLSSYPLFATKTINSPGSHTFHGLTTIPRSGAFRIALTTFDQRRGLAPAGDDTFLPSNASLTVDVVQAATAAGSGTLPGLSGAGSAKHGVKGSGSGALTPITATGSGKIASKGSGIGTLTPLTMGVGSGSSKPPLVTGNASAVLGALAGEGQAKQGITGSGFGQLGSISAEGVASSSPPITTGTGSYTFPTIIAGGLGAHGAKGSGFGVLTILGEGQGRSTPPINVGVGIGSLNPLTGAGLAVSVTSGDAPLTVLPGLAGEGLAIHGVKGSGDGALQPLEGAGRAGLVPTGVATGSLTKITGEGVAAHLTGAFGVGTLTPMTGEGSASQGTTGAAAGELPGLDGASSGKQGVRGSGSIYLVTLNGEVVANHGVSGRGEGVLPVIAGDGRGSSTTGSGSGELPRIVGAGVAGHGVSGAGEGLLTLIGESVARHGVSGSGEGNLSLIGDGSAVQGATGVGFGVMPTLIGFGRDAEAIGRGAGLLPALVGSGKAFSLAKGYAGAAGRKISFDVRTGQITVDATGGKVSVDATGGKVSVEAQGGSVSFDEKARVIGLAA